MFEMEKALALTIAGMVICAALFIFFSVLATDWGAQIGYKVLKEIIRGTVTVAEPKWVYDIILDRWRFAGIEYHDIPWEHKVYETVLMPKVGGHQVFWILAAVFFGLFLMFTVMFADELGVLGKQYIMKLFWALTVIALLVFLGFGIAFQNWILLGLAVALIPIILLGLFMTFTAWGLKITWTLSAVGVLAFILSGLPYLALAFIPLIVLGLVMGLKK
ncbi:MAG: hypothetical protein QXT92_00385 [Nitrososphaerota archaeon]